MPSPDRNKVDILDRSVAYLKGIGPAKANLLAEELNIHSLGDLLHAYPFRYVDRTKFHRIIDINLCGVFRACQIFGNYFLSRDVRASIINVGSISGLNPLSRVFTYSASKAAVHNLTRNLAREWADRDIRVNTLVPGFFPAEQNRAVLDESRIAEILRHTPASRFGSPEELIGATLLLASNAAGGFITGTELVVDGGFNAMSI